MKTISALLLLLTVTICSAQQIIVGDPAEPCGPPKADYWIGRNANPFPQREGAGLSRAWSSSVAPERSRGEVEMESRGVRSNTPPSPKVYPPKPGNMQGAGWALGEGARVRSFTAAALDSYAFGANVRVNDNPAGSSFETPYSSGGHSIACRGDTVYLVWRSDRSGTSQIYFDKSTNGGTTWGPDEAISDNPAAAAVMPALALGQDGTIYVSWTDWRDGNRHIYFAKSTNGGGSFGGNVRVCNEHEEYQAYSSIAVSNSGKIFIAWEDGRNSATQKLDVYCARSDDGGNSFLSNVRVDDTGTDSSGQGGGYSCQGYYSIYNLERL